MLKKDSRKAVSTTIALVIIVILVVAAIGGIYIASQSHSTSTTTATSTVTQTGTGTTSTVTTTTTASGSASSSSSAIPTGEIIDAVVSPLWGTDNVGDDIQCSWGDGSMWFDNNYEQLFQYDPYQLSLGNYVPVPWLASNYTVSANGTVYTINLRQGIHFHSGNTMTSADVVYSFDRFQFATNRSNDFENCPGDGLIYSDTFASMNRIVATGTYQVQLILNYPDPNIIEEITSQGFSIVDSKLLEQHTVVTGSGANATSDWGFAWLDAGPQDAGTGPYQLTSFTYEQRAELQAFSGYWGGPFGNYSSNVNTIIMIPYADATTAQFALEEGQINMVQDETTSAISSIASTPGFTVFTGPGFNAFNLYFHPVGPLSNWEVRDALKESINYTAMTESLTNGYAKPDAEFFPIGSEGYNATLGTYYSTQGPNDTGAAALLKAAGYPNGFSVNLYTRPSSRFGVTFVDLAEILQSDWAAINVTLTIQVYVVGQFYDLAENTSLPGIWTVPSGLIYLSPLSNAEEALGSGDSEFIGWNATTETGPGVNFTQIYQLYNDSATATTVAASNAAMAQLSALYIKYGATVCLMQLSNTVAYSSSLKNVIWNNLQDNFMPYNLQIT